MRLARILLSAVLSGYGPVALAQPSADYPHRAIRIIVPVAAGGNVNAFQAIDMGGCRA